MVKIPWEQTDQYIRSGHRSPEDFQEGSLRTITLSEKEGIKAVVGKPKGSQSMEVQTYLFDKSRGWSVEKAKAWFKQHREGLKVKEHVQAVLPFQILEKIVDKPLRIKGVAMTAGISRNFNVYTSEELQAFADKLAGAPVYIEHVAVPDAVGKVVKAWWDPQGKAVLYEAEIYDDETAEKIRKGLIHHVSVGADYETIDILNGKVPHGLHNAELSLVAVPGIPETNIQILEKLQAKEQAFPLHAVALVKDFKVDGREFITPGEYILGFHRDPYAFLPEHFSTVWLDRQNGILALVGRLKAEPEKRRIQAVFFSKDKMWDEGKIRDWFLLHPHYLIERVENSAPTGENANMQTPLKEREKMNSQKQSEEEKQVEKQAQKGLVEKEEHKQTRLTERVWTRRYINDLPDSAFAVILPGGKKDDEGKTVPRTLRKFPHHDANGKIDRPHLRNANARLPQSDIPQEYKEQAMRHLAAHKKALGIGMASEEAKLIEQTGEGEAEAEFEASHEPTMDELIANTEDLIDQVDKAIESLKNRVEKVEAIVQKGKSEKSVAEQLLKPDQNPNLIDKNEILKLIPPERVVRSWSYGPRLLVNQLRYTLSKSSRDREVSEDELAETG